MAYSFTQLRPQEPNNNFSGIRDIIEDLGPKYVKKQQNTQLYQSLLGLPEEQARALAAYDLPDAVKFLEAIGQREGGMEALQGLSGGGQQQQMMQQRQQMQSQQQQPSYAEATAGRQAPTQDSVDQMAQLLRQPRGLVDQQLKMIQPQMVQQLVDQHAQQKPGESYPLSVAQVLAKPTRKEMRERQTLDLKERKFASEQEARKETRELDTYKFVQPYLDELNSKAHRASELLTVNERLKELETEGGGVSSQSWNEFLTSSGLDTEALRDPNSEEFQKLQQAYTKGAKDIYGSRVTNFDLEQFLKGIPQLSNTPEGRKRLIANFDMQYNLARKERDLAYDIIEKNKGIPPKNLAYLVDKKMSKAKDEAAKQFKKDLKRPVPGASSKAAVLGAKLAGKGVALAGKTISTLAPAAVGAGLGTLVGGPVGTAIGGTAGSIYSLLNKLGQ